MGLRVARGVVTIFLLVLLKDGTATPSHPAHARPHTAHARPRTTHARHSRQLHRILDPFGLLGKAGEAVSGAVEDLGKRIDQGTQHVGKMVQSHVGQMQAGLEEAGKVAGMIGEDLVQSVSTLVSNHLQEEEERGEEAVRRREGIVDGFLRMIGIDSSQVGLMALNVLIFLAELITSSLIGEKVNEIPQSRDSKTSVLSWFIREDPAKMEAMLREAQDPGLPRDIINKLKRATGDDTACVQLLVCKVSPVVWGLQRSVSASQARSKDPDTPSMGIMQTLYDALPPLDTFVNFSESCENQFPACPLIDLSHLGLGL